MSIKPHLFHGFYSNINKGYFPDFPDKESVRRDFYADKPLHVNRAILGSTDPIGGSKVQKFETEEQALDWYKKSRHSKEDYNKIKSSKNGGFCKNYFSIPESDFVKFRQYFNGMIKSINVKSNLYFSINGSYSKTAGGKDNECGEESYNGTWFTYQNYYVDLNSQLILNDDNLQKRVGSKYLLREYILESPIEDTEESETIDALTIESDNRIYDKQWAFQQDKFKNMFTKANKFSRNSTLINDPLIVMGANYIQPINIEYNKLFDIKDELKTYPFFAVSNKVGVGIGYTSEEGFGKNRNESSNNLGTFSISVQNSEGSDSYSNYTVSLAGTVVVYIKSLKKYLCFIELDIHAIASYYAKAIESKSEAPVSAAGLGGPSNPKLFTTDDIVSTQEKPPLELYSSNQDYYPVQKILIEIIICNQPVKIEVWKMSQNSFTWSESPTEVGTPWGSLPVKGPKCFQGSFTITYTFEQPFIEIKGWEKTDFNQNTVYPPKVE